MCAICEAKLASYKCVICGRIVCEDDYNRAGNICRQCTMGKKMR